MTRPRHRVLGSIIAAAALPLLLAAHSLAPPASAQSSGDEDIKAALLGLKDEFPETLYALTPEMLATQRKIVDAMALYKTTITEQQRVGVSSVEDVLSANLRYFRELEALKVMEKRVEDKAASAKDLLRVRIELRTEAVALLREYLPYARSQYQSGTISQATLALNEAKLLKAELVLDAMRKAAQ